MESILISILGSAPGESIKIKGLSNRESTKVASKLKAGGYIKASDISSIISFCTAFENLSVNKILIIISF